MVVVLAAAATHTYIKNNSKIKSSTTVLKKATKHSQVAPYRQNVQMKSGLAKNSTGFVVSTLKPCETDACIPIVPLAF